MWRAREAIATTNFVGDSDKEKGFEGSGIVEGLRAGPSGSCSGCTWRVESQEAEMTRLWSAL